MPQIHFNTNKVFLEYTLLKYLSDNRSSSLTDSELNSLASDIIELSNLFTKNREILPSQYLNNKNLRRAYMMYFLPSNIYKIHLPLKELSLHPQKILSKKEIKILDLGSGPGTTILGILDFFSKQKKRPSLEFTAIDSVVENLSIAKDLFKLFTENVNIDASLKTFKINIEKTEAIPEGSYDIIILSNILNELFYKEEKKIAKRVSFLTTIIRKFLASDGNCIIIEPALRETTREMLEIRDSLVKNGFKIYSPCLIDEPCPALSNPKDWCHEDIPWIPPKIIKEIDKLTGLRKDSLKFSYLVLRKDKLSLSDILEKNSYRVVSEPLVSKGKLEFYICGIGGRRLITMLDKDKTPSNMQFQKLQRGDIVSFRDLIDEGNRFKIDKGTTVANLSSHIYKSPHLYI
ncbi:MAG: hypothetical protein A2W77_07405 [Nitrospinae bacterium RIFCSPLOWO2_12_39_16]|nr:MAG: hypothetical protein A2Z59_13530 [Nitrospinae bacterium RIFCSPLOWO2_02_39_17]OGW11133.1 MAG: hypothetical protein A2W77_07405 [Nitrospinae bacterium RIFCSPLOWO2_12_39_16]